MSSTTGTPHLVRSRLGVKATVRARAWVRPRARVTQGPGSTGHAAQSRVGAHALEQLVAVEARHDDVGDDEVGQEALRDRVEGGVDAAERVDDVATLLQVFAHCRAQPVLILHQHEARLRRRRSLAERWWTHARPQRGVQQQRRGEPRQRPAQRWAHGLLARELVGDNSPPVGENLAPFMHEVKAGSYYSGP